MTAEYDVFLTNPSAKQQILLVQYPNRSRDKPYNASGLALPREMRIKPQAAHMELDISLNTDRNFNKWRGLKWGDALKTGREVQNVSATYGLAAGFTGVRGGVGGGLRRLQLKDAADRELDLSNGLIEFDDAQEQGKVMHTQTLGGQIVHHESATEAGKPVYFVGAFRGSELHLSQVTGSVQLRPQFHHLDAEDQRNRIAASRAAAEAEAAASAAPDIARVVHQTYKPTTINPKGELEQREHEMKMALQTAHEERWVKLEYVDEEEPEAYRVWNERMFVQDTSEAGGCVRLRSGMEDEEFLDAISAPAKEGTVRRRRRSRKGRGSEVVDVDVDVDDGEEG